jgi:hypothetical protein
MTDRSKFEEMLERLVNEDREGAEALFHEIVVERSREIYQSILESEDEDEDLEEASEDDDEDLDEMFDLDEVEMGGDKTDDMLGDIDMDDNDMDDNDMDMDDNDMDMDMDDHHADVGGNEELEDRVMDLEDAIDDLKAEFDAMMSDGNTDMDMDDDDMGDMDMDDTEDDEDFDLDMDDEDEEEDDEQEPKEAFAYESKKSLKNNKAKKTAGEQMREYVEKVNGGFGAKIGGDNGTNTKSTVASKNDMGGTTQNILRTDTEQGTEANKGHLKGSSLFKANAKEDNAGNINVPGGKAGKTAFKKSEPGHGAEKKGKPETADRGAHSTIKGVVRNK